MIEHLLHHEAQEIIKDAKTFVYNNKLRIIKKDKLKELENAIDRYETFQEEVTNDIKKRLQTMGFSPIERYRGCLVIYFDNNIIVDIIIEPFQNYASISRIIDDSVKVELLWEVLYSPLEVTLEEMIKEVLETIEEIKK